MATAFDFSTARPDPAELVAAGAVGVLAYLGSGKPRPTPEYIASLHAAGLWFIFIQESSAARAYEGYAAGRADAAIAEADADAAGYPEECAIYVALGDTNHADAAAHSEAIAEYARGFGDALRRPAFGGYGAREPIDAACAAQPKMRYRWTVESWGARMDGYDHIVQMVNSSPPVGIADADWDQTFADDVGQWPRPGVTPTPTPTPEELAMLGPFVAVWPVKGPAAILFMEHPVTGKKTYHHMQTKGDVQAAVAGGAVDRSGAIDPNNIVQVTDNFVAGYTLVGHDPRL